MKGDAPLRTDAKRAAHGESPAQDDARSRAPQPLREQRQREGIVASSSTKRVGFVRGNSWPSRASSLRSAAFSSAPGTRSSPTSLLRFASAAVRETFNDDE